MTVEFVYPQGGFRRATQYLIHRMRRLPDQPHRIARGIFAGTFVNFPPLFGIQMLSAAALAWVLRGNRVTSGQSVTTPMVAGVDQLTAGAGIDGGAAHGKAYRMAAGYACRSPASRACSRSSGCSA